MRLLGAHIRGQLNCSGGIFANGSRRAFNAEGVTVDGDTAFTERFEARGEVLLLGAKIGGQLNCGGGTFINENGNAITADGMRVGGMYCNEGFEARGHGKDHVTEAPATVLNSLMTITRAAGRIGIPGLYVTDDPGAKDDAARTGSLGLRFGLGWAKSLSFATGQTPVMKYNRALMMAVLHDRIRIAKAVNVKVISLDQAPQGYADFDRGVAEKFVIDPQGLLGA